MKNKTLSALRFSILLSLCLCVSAVNPSCSSNSIDPRSVVPADVLVYLETRDLGKAIGSVSDSTAFAKISKTKPDLSALNGVKMSVAVTGFESSEETVNAESSVLNFQPRFVAVVETNAWSWQGASFVEDKLGEFINEAYGSGVELVVTPKDAGKHYVWTSQDGRKAYALLVGSLILFGNDESAIDKCLAVKRGEADSMAKNPKVTDGERLAFGYVSPDGVAQIANIQAVSLALQTGEDAEVKSFVARVLPEILRNSINDLTWTATQTASGRIDDTYQVGLQTEMGSLFGEIPSGKNDRQLELAKYVPASFATVTFYQLDDARATWQRVLQFAQSKTDPVSAKVITAFAGGFFEPYAVENGDLFLASIRGPLLTVKIDPDSDDSAVVARIANAADIRRSVAKEINFSKPPQMIAGAEIWTSSDGELSAAFAGEILVIGDAGIVNKCLTEKLTGEGTKQFEHFTQFGNMSPVSTFFRDSVMQTQLGKVLGQPGGEPYLQTSLSLTRFEGSTLQRITNSDFGLIGALIAQFAPERESVPPANAN